jgi:phospholipid/cholesterol/gamma-HCH transport system substrate-binding protein
VKRGGRRRRRIPDVTIALIAIAVILAAGYGAFTKRVPFIHGYQVKAVFASSNQLIKGSPVRVAGVKVGQVRKLEPGPGNTMLVTMDVQSAGRPIHRDATMKIRPRLFLEGGFFIDVHPGSPSSPELKSEDTIPLPQTAIPVQFHQVLLALDRPTRGSLRETIDTVAKGFEHQGAQGLNQTFRALPPVLRDTALLTSATLGSHPHDLSGFIDESSQTAQTLAQHDTQLKDLVTGLNRTSSALASQDLALAGTVRQADQLLREAPPSIRAIDAALPTLNRFSVDLRPSLQIAPPILAKAVQALSQLDLVAGPTELPALISILRPAVGQLPQLTRRLNTLFPLVTPVSKCVLTRVGPVLFAKLDDGNLSSGQPVWQEMLHTFGGLAGASQNYDGNGASIRFLLGGGDSLLQINNFPNLGQIFASLDSKNPIIGARPVWLGSRVLPPYRPDADCAAQTFPDLTARGSLNAVSGTAARARPRAKVTAQEIKDLANGATGASGATGATGATGAGG